MMYRSIFEAIPSGRVYAGDVEPQTQPSDADYLRKHGAKLQPAENLLIDVPQGHANPKLDQEEEERYLRKFGPVVNSEDSAEEDEDYEEDEEEEHELHLGYDEEKDEDLYFELEDDDDNAEERYHEISTKNNFDFSHNVNFYNEPVARALAKSRDGKFFFIRYIDNFTAGNPDTVAIVPQADIHWIDRSANVLRVPEGGNAYDAYGYYAGSAGWKFHHYTSRARAMMDSASAKGLIR